MFLQGELYTRRMVNNPPAAAWLSLGAYVKSLLPDIQTGTQTDTNPDGTSNDPRKYA